MDNQLIKKSIWSQFGAAIDMLENALLACPDQLWEKSLWHHPGEKPGYSQFYYLAYHTLFFLDLYLSGSAEGFVPPAPFNLDELDPAGLLPERPFSKVELLTYLDHGRRKCKKTIESLSDEEAFRTCKLHWGEVSFVELLLDNMRHVQEHGAQLNLFLGQNTVPVSNWVSRTRDQTI